MYGQIDIARQSKTFRLLETSYIVRVKAVQYCSKEWNKLSASRRLALGFLPRDLGFTSNTTYERIVPLYDFLMGAECTVGIIKAGG